MQADLANQSAALQAARANQEAGLQAALANQQAGLEGAKFNALYNPGQAELAALSGMTGLYGTNPALANVFGNQVLNAQGQQLSLEELQNQAANARVNQQYQLANIPGNFQSALGNIAGGLGAIGQIGAGVAGVGNIWNQAKQLPGMFGGGGQQQIPNISYPYSGSRSPYGSEWLRPTLPNVGGW
jgi:hypothetical protein